MEPDQDLFEQVAYCLPCTRKKNKMHTTRLKVQKLREPNVKHELKGSVKELNKLHIYETEKITHKASDAAEYIELFGSSTRDRHARRRMRRRA